MPLSCAMVLLLFCLEDLVKMILQNGKIEDLSFVVSS